MMNTLSEGLYILEVKQMFFCEFHEVHRLYVPANVFVKCEGAPSMVPRAASLLTLFLVKY